MRFIRSNKRTASLHLRRAEVLKCPLGLAPFWYEFHAKYPLGFSRPAAPTDDAPIGSFNARVRKECLNDHWFESIPDACAKLRAWQRQYNEEYPHSALGYLVPNAFAKTHANTPQK